jgi:hypothetical protein
MSYESRKFEEIDAIIERFNKRVARLEKAQRTQAGAQETGATRRASVYARPVQLPRNTWGLEVWQEEAVFGLKAAIEAQANRMLWQTTRW